MANLAEGSPSSRTFLTIQALRGLAAIMVVVFHVRDQLHGPFLPWLNTTAGVDVFFVISGFIIPLSIRKTAAPAHDAANFLRRRIERIYPIYWILTTLKLAMIVLRPGVSSSGAGTPYHIIASYLLIPSFYPNGFVQPILPPGWSLIYEMFFYVLLTVALLVRVPLRWFMPAVLIPFALLALVPIPHAIPLAPNQMPAVLEFLAGMAIAWNFRNRKIVLGNRAYGVLAALALVLLLLVPTPALPRVFTTDLPAFLLVAAAVGLEGAIGKRIPSPILLLGDASYSIYLTHWFLLPVMRSLEVRLRFTPLGSTSAVALISIALCLVTGIVCYFSIERPINRFFQVRRRTALAIPRPLSA